MRGFKLVLNILLKNGLRATNGGKSKTSQWLIAGIGMLPLVVLTCFMLSVVSVISANQGIFAELLVSVISAVQIFAFFLAVQGILSSLYLAEDNAWLSSLPVSPTAVYFAKITRIYLMELGLSLYLLLPTLLTMTISADVNGYYVFPAFYPLIIVIIMLTPVLPLAAATLLSLPLMWLSKFFKRRAAMGTIVALILFGAVFGAYYAIIPNLADVSEMTSMSESTIEVLRILSNVFYPNKAVIFAALGINGWVNLGVTVAIYVVLFALIILLTRAFYAKAVASQLETYGKHSLKATTYKKKNKIAALISRDFTSLVRYPGLALSSFMNIVLAPIMLIVLFNYTGDTYLSLVPITESSTLITELVYTGIALLYSILLNSGINSTAGLAFTRDGRTFYIVKHLPITPKEVVTAKLLFADIVSVVGTLPLFLIVLFAVNLQWYSAILFAVTVILVSCGMNALGIYFDMRRPNLDWTDTSEIQRNNNFMLIPFLICLVLGFGLLAVACVFSATESVLGTGGSIGVFWVIDIVVSLLVFLCLNALLMKKGIKLYDTMEERKVNISQKKKQKLPLQKSNGFLK